MTKLPSLFDRSELSPFFDHSVGFDRMFDRLLDQKLTAPNFPPYNIRKVNEVDRMIEMAVAGYSEKDIDITLEDGILTIKGDKVSEETEDSNNYLHKGVAMRKFTRQFRLADTAEVRDATLEHGMLNILIALPEPESKVQRIAINGGKVSGKTYNNDDTLTGGDINKKKKSFF